MAQLTLGHSAARGGGITLVGQAAKFIFLLVSLVLLSRLLDPSAFGLIAMTTVLLAVGELLRDFGLTAAAIQTPRLSTPQKNNLFWTNCVLGLIVMMTLWLFAAPAAVLYSEPRVEELIWWLAPVALLNAVQAQFQIELTRNLRFGALVTTDVAAQAIGLVAAVLAALGGMSYWALVIQQITIAACLLTSRFALSKWRPGLPDRRTSIRSFFRYGFHLTLAQGLGLASSNADTVVIGARFGAVDLGIYSRAFQLLMAPINQVLVPLTNVALSVLSRLSNEATRFYAYLMGAQLALSYSLGFVFGVSAAAAVPAIGLLLGPNWSNAAPIFQVLAIGGLFQVLSVIGYWVFLSKGLTRSLLHYNLVTKTLTIGCVILGSVWGPIGVAWGYAGALAIAWPVCILWLRKVAGMPSRSFLLAGLRSIGASVAAFSVGTVVLSSVKIVDGELLQLALVVASSTAGFSMLLVLRSVRKDFRSVLSTVLMLRGPR